MAITDTITNIVDYIKQIALTRADINLSNLSHQGKAEIALQSNGIPWTVTSNVLTSATDVTMTASSGNYTFSGTVDALIPNGKSVQHPGMCDSVEANIVIQNTPVTTTLDLSIPRAVMVTQEGAVSIVNYVVSYSAPMGAVSGDMWYDLSENYLKIFGTEWTNFNGVKLGSLKYDEQKNVVFTGAGAVQLPDFDTIMTEVELAKAPTGTVIAYMGTDEPPGYLLMDGRELSRTTYSRLFSVIGTTQGAGDGSTTFNIADMTDGRYLMGSTVAGGSVGAGLPNISGYFFASMTQGNFLNYGTGAFWGYERTTSSQNVPTVGGVYDSNNSWGFDASRSSSIYGSKSTVVPQSITVQFFIKI